MSHFDFSCRHFNGYKPCGSAALDGSCPSRCPKKEARGKSVLLIHLGALGAVVRSTTLLEPIRKKYPFAQITWVTLAPADQILKAHPLIDRVISSAQLDVDSLHDLHFDVLFCVDKSIAATAIAKKQYKAQTIKPAWFGFDHDEKSGAIVPRTDKAKELWQLGLSNHLKFQVNKKSEAQLTCEALDLPFTRSRYGLELTNFEKNVRDIRRSAWLENKKGVVGFNTGCSQALTAKKLSVAVHVDLIAATHMKHPEATLVLLGGKEDRLRNHEITLALANRGVMVVNSPNSDGVRDGMISIDACDIVVSGDSLGMHLAIAFQKWVVAWFGPTCIQEIDLFDNGLKVATEAACSPCWKQDCTKAVMCYDQVSIPKLVNGIEKGMQWNASSSTKPLFSEISSSQFL